ncbi:MAG: efflux RND transporter periplasmic adaptor subunit [Patescibacteria group bacterium]|jgi:RND family efflux transporter MFP subunit
MTQRIFSAIKNHKIIAFFMILIISGGGYYGYNKYKAGNIQPSYITSAVEQGTLITSVSSSGQISASNQVDVKAKVSGDIAKIAVVSGQEVKSGGLIAQIDARDAYKTVRDAQSSLQSAQLAMDKLKQAASANSLSQAENSVASAQTSLDKLKLSQPIDYQNGKDSLQNAQTNLGKAYSDAFNDISNTFLSLPDMVVSLDDILHSEEISASEASLDIGQINTAVLLNSTFEYGIDRSKIISYQAGAENDYAAALKVYDLAYQDFKNASIYSAPQAVENLLDKTFTAAKAIAQAVKSENNYLTTWSDFRVLRDQSVFTQVTAYKTDLAAYAGQTNTFLSNLLSAQAAIKTYKDAIAAANNNLKTLTQNQPLDLAASENSLREKQAALAELKGGADPLDIKSQELSLQQKRNALYDAQIALADYAVKAPFDGIIAAVNLKAGDSASGAIATIMTKQRIAEISLNEVDAAKIKIGDKATLTFDALDGLSISGQAAEIDSLGTVTQGVVTYNVKIVFDTQDDRVKSGMSVNATIITGVKTDVLMAPNSAVKTDANGGSYVQTLDSAGQPQNITVQIGLANDANTEIISGLNEGDKVITQTITSGAAKTTTAQTGNGGGIRIPGIGGGR